MKRSFAAICASIIIVGTVTGALWAQTPTGLRSPPVILQAPAASTDTFRPQPRPDVPSGEVPLPQGLFVQNPLPALPDQPSAQDNTLALPGKLPADAWTAYKARFVTETGRVVDTANNNISHSEGQGYAMVLAVAARDRATFDRIWNWTRANLMVRDDQLVAWRWEPNARPAVGDMNNATDGDILIAWALAEAAEFWKNMPYRVAGRRIAVEVGRKVILNQTRFGSVILPAVSGFAAESRNDGPVANLSYWVFPALLRLNLVAPEFNWAAIGQTGVNLIRSARFGSLQLPADWISLRGNEPRPADGFPQVFGYEGIRIPLYLAWSGLGDREVYAPFASLWERGSPAVFDVATGRRGQPMTEPGYAAVAALTSCAASGKALPSSFRSPSATQNYYPATLHLLALIAAQSRYGSCSRAP